MLNFFLPLSAKNGILGSNDSHCLGFASSIVCSISHIILARWLAQQRRLRARKDDIAPPAKHSSDDPRGLEPVADKIDEAATDSPSPRQDCSWLALLTFPVPHAVANRLVSLLHALVSITFGIAALFLEPRPCGAPLGVLQRRGLELSFGYFLYDTVFELWNKGPIDIVFHHVVALFGVFWGLWSGRSGTELMTSLVIAEISTPALHYRYLLQAVKNQSAYGRRMFELASYIFAITFLVSRVLVFGPIITYATLVSAETPTAVKCGAVLMFSVSLMWGIKIGNMARRKIFQVEGHNQLPEVMEETLFQENIN